MQKKIIKILVIILSAYFLYNFLFFSDFLKGNKKEILNIRVLLYHPEENATIFSKDPIDIYYPNENKLIKNCDEIESAVEVCSNTAGIKIGDEIFPYEVVELVARGHNGIQINDYTYRGKIRILKEVDKIEIVNVVGIEDYLKGVLPCEVNRLWPFETLKAQAIASRSYAAYESLRRQKKRYDVTADTFSQVYKGKTRENWRTTQAVLKTEGMVLEYNGNVFPGYFHSSCGGHTADVEKVWSKEMEPLQGKKCGYCKVSPYFRWRIRLSTKTILEKLIEKGYQIKRIDNIKLSERDESGRVEYVSIRAWNKWFEIDTNDFRNAIGKRLLKSSNFNIKKYPFFYVFSGYGWGHGVGMCQWGAFGMGLRWKKTGTILEYYYPGTKISNLKDIMISQ